MGGFGPGGFGGDLGWGEVGRGCGGFAVWGVGGGGGGFCFVCVFLGWGGGGVVVFFGRVRGGGVWGRV